MGRKPYSWTFEQLKKLRHLREKEGLIWADVGLRMHMKADRCAATYAYYKSKGFMFSNGHAETAVAEVTQDDSPIYGGGRVPERVGADLAVTRADAPSPSPSARRYHSPPAFDVMLRVQTQGITAGLFGDPIAGRNALDRKKENMGTITSVRMSEPSVREEPNKVSRAKALTH